MTIETIILDNLLQDLRSYADPMHADGFVEKFCHWVLREWENRPYFLSERIPISSGYVYQPHKTNFFLREKAITFFDFIHSHNGSYYASYVSDLGMACEKIENDFYEFFHESMRERALEFLSIRYPGLDPERFWDAIFCEEFSEIEEVKLAEEIVFSFGLYGFEADPYTCHYSDHKGTIEGQFAHWTRSDFKNAVLKVEEYKARA